MYVFSFEVDTTGDPSTLLDLTIEIIEGHDGLLSRIRDYGDEAECDNNTVCVSYKKEK